jgi:enamine deaminase RidA (YjgF/YER057c/UK114 family)
MMRTGFSLLCVWMAGVFMGTSLTANDHIQHIDQGKQPGSSTAVVLRSERLIHTGQIFPLAVADNVRASVADQFASVMDQARKSLAGVHAGTMVKLNLYVTNEAVASEVLTALPKYFPENQPSVSLVVTKLPSPGIDVGADFISVVTDKAQPVVARSSRMGELPEGSRIYVSGQAEQDMSLAVATRKTLESLRKTLVFLGRSDADIVQLKAFIQPMQDWKIVQAEVDAFYAGQPAVPLILVEWKSGATVPIEIELIAAGGKPPADAPSMEYLTPPGMTTPTIYCRVCRINHPGTIYVSGLYSAHDRTKHPDTAANGDLEVESVFAQLKDVLAKANSDFEHLAKATYYVSSEAASASLNKLRPGYYNPQRPPAASKAAVDSVGVAGLGLTIDMIAVPDTKP